jgi:tetrapyrrole methylase family protein/MazG family protein
MEYLRSPEGCPWDREQTHETIIKSMIEEAYEVVEAIELSNRDKLVEELGDVLLQVVFHSQIGKEEGSFDISDVIDNVSQKMVSRHTHVFGAAKADTSEEVLDNWEEIKKRQKGVEGLAEDLDEIPKTLPSLMFAAKVCKKLRKNGKSLTLNTEKFKDFDETEINEKQLGDLLFTLCAIAEVHGIEPELALRNKAAEIISAQKEEQIEDR